jgi:hypothetical protein
MNKDKHDHSCNKGQPFYLFLNYTNVNSYFVNYYSHSIKEVALLYQHLHSGHFYK